VAVKLRLMRMGKKKQPTYRLVAADGRSPRDGRFIEIVGTYDPRAEPSVVNVDNDKAVAWLRKGAQASEPAAKLLKISGAWEQFKAGAPTP
jgi:small subunit ribosomal protein S16